jgi:hypothetical protein
MRATLIMLVAVLAGVALGYFGSMVARTADKTEFEFSSPDVLLVDTSNRFR